MKFETDYKGKEPCDACGGKSSSKLEHEGRTLYFCNDHKELVGAIMFADPGRISKGKKIMDESHRKITTGDDQRWEIGIAADGSPVVYCEATNKSYNLDIENLIFLAMRNKVSEK